MTIKEAVEILRKEKGCRTLEANICFSKSCDECKYCISESALTEALCVVVPYLDELTEALCVVVPYLDENLSGDDI